MPIIRNINTKFVLNHYKEIFILYANPFARVQDFSESVLEELTMIDDRRKSTA